MELVEAGRARRATTCELIGADAEAIATAEDRELFKQAMIGIGLDVPSSGTARRQRSACAKGEQVAAAMDVARRSTTSACPS
ncbi:MAG: hypothetical protein V9E96_04580 [Chitinophagaceae bacterium]